MIDRFYCQACHKHFYSLDLRLARDLCLRCWIERVTR